MKEDNLYTKGNEYQFRKSYCGYLDILGFSEKIMKNDIPFFNKYLKTLNTELIHIHKNHDLHNVKGLKSFELKVFTDNFVFGLPWVDRFGESELGEIFEVLAHIQLTFIKSDVYIRGAISLSELFMNENIVLGPALIEAYKLESEKAIYPRIILSQNMVKVIEEHMGYYADHKTSPQNQTFLIDVDGFYFINYLFILFFDNQYSDIQIKKELLEHKKSIIRNLEKFKNNFKLFDKYSWSAKYHNYFCDNYYAVEFPKRKIENIKIEESLISKTIRTIK